MLTQSIREGEVRYLADAAEVELMKKLSQWPRLVEQAAIHDEPHRVVYYVHEVASAFHALWSKGKENPALRFVQPEDLPGTTARLMLVQATQTVIASALALCGVEPADLM